MSKLYFYSFLTHFLYFSCSRNFQYVVACRRQPSNLILYSYPYIQRLWKPWCKQKQTLCLTTLLLWRPMHKISWWLQAWHQRGDERERRHLAARCQTNRPPLPGRTNKRVNIRYSLPIKTKRSIVVLNIFFCHIQKENKRLIVLTN